MVKQAHLNLSLFRNFQDFKHSAHLYRRKLALKIKEVLEGDFTADDVQIAVGNSTSTLLKPEQQQSRK
jgi:hypothetical protein